MPTRLVQLEHHPSGTAVFTVVGPSQNQLPIAEDLEIAIVQGGALDRYLDPRNPRAPWSAAVFRFRPISGRRENGALLLEIDHGVTHHIQPNQPYRLLIRQVAGLEIEERFTGPAAMRRPAPMPEGWQPPAPPDGPLKVPQAASAPPSPVTEPAGEIPVTPVDVQPAIVDESLPIVQDETKGGGDIDEQKVVPVDSRSASRKWIVWLLVLLLAAAAGAAWYVFGHRQGADPAPVDPAASGASQASVAPPAALGTLDAVRDYLSKDPPADEVLAQANKLSQDSKLLQGQMLLYKYAGEHGNAEAARRMGNFYDPDTWAAETSPFSQPNQVEAARWHLQAAQAGDAQSQYRYGMLLKKGRTELADGPEQAVAWLRKSAEQGNADAKKELGP